MRKAVTTNHQNRRGRSRRSTAIRLHVPVEIRFLLDQAAKMHGQTLAEFVLSSAKLRAEEIFLDQRLFLLSSEAHDRFLAILDAPALPRKESIVRLLCSVPWKY